MQQSFGVLRALFHQQKLSKVWKVQQLSISRRWFHGCPRQEQISAHVEPPLDGEGVVQKPFTVVLLEDPVIYLPRSWQKDFESSFPRKSGITVASLLLSTTSFDAFLAELKMDLSTIHDAVFVARGPLSSWSAQLYLESYSLEGLIMVDPLELNSPSPFQAGMKHAGYPVKGENLSMELQAYISCLNEARNKNVQLEANSVPMAIISESKVLPADHLLDVASRHSDENGPYGLLPITVLPESDGSSAVAVIDNWIINTL